MESIQVKLEKEKNLLATSLDETYQDTFESSSLRATSYIEALTADMLKRYYPFPSKIKQANGQAVSHIQGRATSNIRKLLAVKTKVRDTNIHHAIDALLIGLTNRSWLQKLSNTFRENIGVIDDEARAKITKQIPLIEGIEPKELVEMIEDKYNIYGEESVFYKDIWNNTKVVNFWVSKKPMVSKIHKDTVYAKKPNGLFTVREDIIKQFIGLKITYKTAPKKFIESFEKNILKKMYLFITNPNDIICKTVQARGYELYKLLESFAVLDTEDKEQVATAKEKLDELVHKELIDNNGNTIRKVKFYQSNLTGFYVRGGLATMEKIFIGFYVKDNDKLKYIRIDVSNLKEIQKSNDSSFKAFKNEIVFFLYPDGSFRGGRMVSFLEDKSIVAFANPKYPASYKFQPDFYCKDKAKTGARQTSVNKSTGILKLNLDIIGNIKSYNTIGVVPQEVIDQILHKE